MMAHVKYVGPSRDGVDVPYRGAVFHLPWDVATDVPDELAEGLCDQPIFEKVAKPAKG